MGLTTPRVALRGLLFGTALLVVTPSFAIDAKTLADQLVSMIGQDGDATASYDSASEAGGQITITGFKINSTDGSNGEVSQIIVTNAADRAEGGFTADRIELGNGRIVADDTTISWATGAFEGAIVPPPGQMTDPRFTPFTRMSMDGLTLSGSEMPAPLPINRVAMSVGSINNGVPNDVTFTLSGMEIPLAYIDDPTAQQQMQALGYTNGFVADFTVDGGYQPNADTIDVRGLSLDIRDVGKLEISGLFSGVPLGQMAEAGGAEALMQSAKLDRLRIRFTNSGLVDRLLDMQAQAMGASRADMVTQLTSALPLMLNVIGNQGFQDQASAAISAFLQSPQSITISAGPSSPVPVAQVIGAFFQAPQTLPDVLTVTITSND